MTRKGKNARIPSELSLLILCEGASECNYLEGYRKELHISRQTVSIVTAGPDPKTLYQKAQDEIKSKDQRIDKAIIVCDGIEHDSIIRVYEACRKEKKIMLCVSNPCMELWFYLHFSDKEIKNDRWKMRQKLKDKLPDYDKNDKNIWGMLRNHMEDAKKRAMILEKWNAENDKDWLDSCHTDIPKVLGKIEACKATQAVPTRKPRR